MPRPPYPLALALLGLLLTAGAAAPTPEPAACRLQIIPDYTLGITYRAVLRLSPECAERASLRIRKSSTQNVRRDGAPYQPIKPTVGAWDLGPKTTVPAGELWTLSSWRWEYYDVAAWSTRLGQLGRWRAGEVLRAAP